MFGMFRLVTYQSGPSLRCTDHDFQIKGKLEKVLAKQRELTEKWDKHWEELQHSESLHHGLTESVNPSIKCCSVLHCFLSLFVFVTPISLFPISVLEVHQFAQEAAVAESWLSSQETVLFSQELGASVDEVEQLIRRHEAFRKAATAWEERFSSLRRLTSVSSNICIRLSLCLYDYII